MVFRKIADVVIHFLVSYFVLAIVLVCFSDCWIGTNTAEVLRPRGVSLSHKIFYEPSRDFNCIDGSGTFPFFFVNDDYCDCADGSDEPGTAACPEGLFHCANNGYISRNIPSSRVNDGICDCCDGSDEYNSSVECFNICMELGKQARDEKRKKEELFRKGYQMYQEYSEQGKQIKESNKVKLESLKKDEQETNKIKSETEALKNEAESKEKDALSKYEAIKEDQNRQAEELEMQKHQDEERQNAQAAFHELDLNQDGMLTLNEVQQFLKFDSNKDGQVSEDEGKFFLHMKASMDLEEFVNTGWMIMKPIYTITQQPTEISSPDVPSEPEPEPDSSSAPEEVEKEEYEEDMNEPTENEEDLMDDEEVEVDEEEEEEDSEQTPDLDAKKDSESNEDLYDEETQKLVRDATQAREIYKEALEKFENILSDIRQVEADIDGDFGLDEQFAVLKGQCFEYEDREYRYKLCPFDIASQIAKSGGSDVSLGRWGHWAGPEDNKYAKMKFENGQSCWNGPSRSVMVLLNCGLENKLLSASEPNRCEYLFKFNTPAVCYLNEKIQKKHEHTEL